MAPRAHAERLLPGPAGWLIAVGFCVSIGVVFSPLGLPAALIATALALAASAGWLIRVSPRITVADGALAAGRARLPLAAVAEATPLDGGQLRAALGPGLDARAHLCVRGWITSAVLVRLDDPGDPTPYWLVSTRRPSELAAAINGYAHSLQTG